MFRFTIKSLVLLATAACVQALPISSALLRTGSQLKGTAPEFVAAQIFPSAMVDWLVRPILAIVALGIARACWLRRVKREKRQAQQAAVQLVQHTRQLALEKEDAEKASRTKSQLLASINREIQPPMNGVLNSLELALMTDLTGEQRYHLERTKSHAREALAVLGTALESFASGTSILKVSHVPFSLRDCVRSVVNRITAPAKENGVDLQTEIAPDCPESLIGDPDLLHKVLHNLLKTAIPLASPGKLSLVAHPDRRAETHGLSSNRPAFLFFSLEERSRRALKNPTDSRTSSSPMDKAASRADDNTEAIMSECRALLKLLNGSLWVYTADGRGSKICLTAQFEMAPSSKLQEGSGTVFEGKGGTAAEGRILLIEDHRASQLALLPVLEQQGLRCLFANHGAEAVDLLERCSFDLVIVDCNTLSAEDPAIRRLILEIEKQQPGAHVPILALAGRVTRAEQQEYLRAGVTECISKPVEPDELHRVIRNLLSARLSAAPTQVR